MCCVCVAQCLPSSTISVTESSSSREGERLLTSADRKRVLLNRLMGYFYSIFSASLSFSPYIRAHGHNQALRPQESNSSRQEQPASGIHSSQNAPHKRSRQDGDDGGDEEPRENKRVRMGTDTPAEEVSQRLACPFFKKDPRQYQSWRSCPGPGWPTVHRLK